MSIHSETPSAHHPILTVSLLLVFAPFIGFFRLD